MENTRSTPAAAANDVASTPHDGGPTASVVADKDRLAFLPKFFGLRHMMAGESQVYDWMKALCPSYCGGYWQFFTLSNGGFYMALDDGGRGTHLHLRWSGNGFDGEMSCDAAGVAVTLYALSHLAIETEDERIGELYHLLRDFAAFHAERRSIFAVID